ncbi:TRSP domain C terminus to PRTase_2 [Bacillus sp. OV166]|uniref:phosphoribosyltransferase family protein n=1 Tax=unclassified Bacillus (in: firmicutes) TaxID=185979 RepID=UPI000A2AC823|nr:MULTISPECIES: phosphoribosyltransferase family protein [unclassified Bacillus (in: firmicutes)]SMQ82284.1 TRSP domain C terminus to PRTase_2 [Bacillus sp. OV166]
MKNSQPLTLSKKKYMYNILDSIETEIEVSENPYDLPLEELFTMAARINKKRSFLFVSKVLGKHLPIDPNKGLQTGALLGARFLETVKKIKCLETESLLTSFKNGESYQSKAFIPDNIRPVVIGFAETATSLGHAFFDCFISAEYFHTTREELEQEKPKITFEEEHSHATSHRCFIPLEMIQNEREIILVDDELTTGKTALNIIQSIHAKFPRRIYTVVSILDWRSEENRYGFSRLEQDLGIKINVVSLLAGTVQVKQHNDMNNWSIKVESNKRVESSVERIDLSPFFTMTLYSANNPMNKSAFIKETGRFGLSSTENRSLQQKASAAAAVLYNKRIGKRTLCLGTGEFMYLPMKLAAEMGKGVYYQSTTRSPIFIEDKVGYGARFGASFPNPEDQDITHFFYNIPPGFYDEIFIFFERTVKLENLQPLLKELSKLQIKMIRLVFFSEYRGEQVENHNQ